MEKYLQPERFHSIPNTTDADKTWLHWKRTFTSFLQSVSTTTADVNNLDMLVNYVSPSVYEYISECTTCDSAIKFFESLFIVPRNEIFVRHLLATRHHQAGETLDAYLNVLKQGRFLG